MYSVWFMPGLSGTWLVWFINQHQNFPQFDIKKVIRKGHQTDYALPVANLVYRDYNSGIFKDGNKTFQKTSAQQVIDEIKHYSGTINPDFTKACVKMFPHHALDNDEHLVESICTEYEISHIVWPYVETTNLDTIVSRLFALKHNILYPGNKKGLRVNEFLELSQKLIQSDGPLCHLHQHAALLPVDIGKLLDKDQAEYTRLLEFISAPPLDNWQQLIDNMVSEVYNGWETIIGPI
jgi:hypothetical protein